MTKVKTRMAVEQFEEQVFRGAHEFVAVLFVPRAANRRELFNSFPKACEAAAKMSDEFGRRGLVYANNTAGRSVCIDRADWPRFLTIWNEMHKVNAGRET